MSDTNISGGGTSSVWHSGTTETTESQYADKTAQTMRTLADTSDTIMRSSTVKGIGIFIYNTEPNNPLLPEATVHVINIQEFFSTTAPEEQETPPDPNLRFSEEFQVNINKFLQQTDMEQMAGEMGGLTQEQLEAKLKFAFNFPQMNSNEQISDLLKMFESQSLEQVIEEFELPKDWSPNVNTESEMKFLDTVFNGKFDNIIKGHPNKGKILFALSHPEYAEQLDPEVKAQLKEIVQEVLSQMKNQFGITSQFPTPSINKEKVDAQMTVSYNEAFENALKDADDLSKTEKRTLRAMFYMPELNVSPGDKLEKIFNKLKESAMKGLQEEFGVPKDWEQQPSNLMYRAILNGKFRKYFNRFVEKRVEKGKISPEMLSEIRTLQSNPNASVSNEAKALFQELVEKATEKTKTKMGIEGTDWKPTELVPGNEDYNPTLQHAMDNAMETYEGAVNAVNMLPDADPNKVKLLDFLKAIGEALSTAQEMLYLIQSHDSKLATVLANVMKETQLNKIKTQQEQIDAQRKEREKQQKEAEKAQGGKGGFMGFLGKVMKIFAPIMCVLLVVSASMLAPITGGLSFVLMTAAYALLVASIADSAMTFNGGEGLWDKAYQKLEEITLQMMPDYFPDDLKQMVVIMTKLTAVLTVTAAVGLMGPIGAMMAADYLVDHLLASQVLTETFDLMGLPPEAQMALTVIIIVTIILATIVAQVIATSFIPGVGTAAGVSKGAAQATAQTTKTAATVTVQSSKIARAAAQASRVASRVSEQATKAFQQAGKLAEKAQKTAAKAAQYVSKGMNKITKGKQMVSEGKDLVAQSKNLTKQGKLQEAAKAYNKGKELIKAGKKEIEEGEKLVDRGQRLATKSKDYAKRASEKYDEGMEIMNKDVTNMSRAEKVENAKNVEAAEKYIEIHKADKAAKAQRIDELKAAKEAGEIDEYQYAAQLDKLETASDYHKMTKFEKAVYNARQNFDRFMDKTKSARKWGERMKRGLEGGAEVSKGVYQASVQYRQMKFHLDMAELALMMGRMEAYLKEVDALINLLKQIIKTLIEGLEGIANDIQAISKQLVGLHKQMSQAMTGISLATG
ncbi:MAG: hypothetical protein H7A37_01700 [Chlamydiales bacterium]|nr:hypothetical protein [Chlamydiia bacterium]MCP5507003.1 hypothetical protein [Chlamydiales bacterium]